MWGMVKTSEPSPQSVYDFEAIGIDGRSVALDKYRHRVLLIVNTASECGFTPQLEGLQALWRSYRTRGLVVLGFPSNEFGAQEPGSDADIAAFCSARYAVTFPLMSKIEVNGPGAHPLYRWLCAQAPGLLGSEAIKWNFTKFLVGRDGQVLQRYAPTAAPESLREDIKAALKR